MNQNTGLEAVQDYSNIAIRLKEMYGKKLFLRPKKIWKRGFRRDFIANGLESFCLNNREIM